MISYDDALKVAKGRRKDINQVAEYANGYVFSNTDDENYDGGTAHSPIVVLRKNGEIVTMIEFINSGTGKEIGMRAI